MKETYEFRFDGYRAWSVLEPGEGKPLGSERPARVVRVVLSPDNPRFAEIGDEQRELRGKGGTLWTSWQVRREYSRHELESAEILRLIPTCHFEPAGEECGTIYDYTESCPVCGAGRTQVSDLKLQLSKIPKRADIAVSIADEWVFSERLARVVLDSSITGVMPRALSSRCAGAGQSQWYQPVLTSDAVSSAPITRYGIDPFDEDAAGRYRCPLGHVAGLNIISEIYIERASWGGEDIAETRQMVGARGGLLVPFPLVIISQRFHQLLVSEKTRGFRAEVAHLV